MIIDFVTCHVILRKCAQNVLFYNRSIYVLDKRKQL